MKFSTFSLFLAISSSAALIAAVPLGFSNYTEISERGAVDLGDWQLSGRDESNVYSREPMEWQLSERDLERRANPKPIEVKQWKKDDRNVKITKFVATAVKMHDVFDPKDSTKQLIHWRGGVAWEIGKGKWRSTSLDTIKLSPDDPDITVQFISKNFDVSSFAPYHWEAKLAKEYTTAQVYDLLTKKKFNHYSYNGNGSGCLTWTTALVKLFEDEGILAKGSKASFEKKVAEVRNDPKFWVPVETGAKFY